MWAIVWGQYGMGTFKRRENDCYFFPLQFVTPTFVFLYVLLLFWSTSWCVCFIFFVKKLELSSTKKQQTKKISINKGQAHQTQNTKKKEVRRKKQQERSNKKEATRKKQEEGKQLS